MNTQDNEQTRLLKEILKWIRFSGMKEVKNTLNNVLDSDVKKFIYQKSDGTKGTVELAKLAGLGSNKTVDDLWNVWLKLSLGESIPVRGGSRFKRSFSLEDFCIEVPEMKAKNTPEGDKKEPTEQNPEVKK